MVATFYIPQAGNRVLNIFTSTSFTFAKIRTENFQSHISYFSAMKIWILFIILLCGFCACQKENKDTTPPVINSLSIDAVEYVPNDVMNLQVSLSDNASLNQVRVRISQAFSKTFTHWDELSIRDISGTSFQGTFSFVVPDSVTAGYYQIATQAADMEGNGTIDSLIYFTILQPESAPQLIDFQTNPPMIGEVIYLNSTDTLSFVGQATDDINLSKLSVILQTASERAIKTVSFNITDSVTTWDFATQNDTIFPDYDVYQPSELLIKILDSDGNLTRKSFPVEFTP